MQKLINFVYYPYKEYFFKLLVVINVSLSDKSLNKTIKKYSYSISEIMKIIFIENPNIDKDECYKQAKMFYKEINKSNMEIVRNTGKYFEYNLPLSLFEENDESDDLEFNEGD